ncbi:MAG: hypothetical protein NT133_19495 [Alphaproteobacteria bacterium]|nr:hypothetical protein [Alphaproteobacteria bacterium]
MTIAPIFAPESSQEVIAALAGILRALLAALFGDAGLPRRRHHRASRGRMMAGAAAGEAFGPDLETTDVEEWIAVPAPWRAARWAVTPRRRWHIAPWPRHALPRASHARAPPALSATPHRLHSRIAQRRCAGASARLLFFQT